MESLTPPPMTLARLCRRVRGLNAWSMEALGNRAGLSKNQISRIEMGAGNNLTVANVYALAKALKASPAAVLTAAKAGLDLQPKEAPDGAQPD